MFKRNDLKDLERMFDMPPSHVRNMIGDFHADMKNGLAGRQSPLKMLPSFVKRPSGAEKGRYLAMDLGGTNLRILCVELDGRGGANVTAMSRFGVAKHLMNGPGAALFDFMAQCLADFLRQNSIGPDDRPALAFTFSFPTEQTAIAAGRLIIWTKGFSASGVVGQDVVKLLEEALARKGLRFIRITALVNDTIGTLVSKSYADRSCDAGVILGTGTNACYPEKISNIARNKNPGRDGEMIINIEWGNFAGLAQTPYDVELDKCSRNPGFQFLEKMVSGMYLGALASKMLADMGLRGVSEFFRGGHELKTEDMSRIAGNDFRALAESGLEHIGPDERKTLQNICGLTARRSARLAGAAIAAVITWMDPQLLREHLVGIDGSLFELYPRYRENICGVFDDIFGAKARGIRLELAKDGSGIGAAITAAIAEQTGQ